tara:strand:+ start:2118 stop:3212 length:1095 start_codon:yes stop_codon:yes gene_type:complete
MKFCTNCLLNDQLSHVKVGEDGICNFCKNQSKIDVDFSKRKLKKLLERTKVLNKSSKYDCIIGISGGLDSSYLLLKACELGLKPLAVHMDNGWNTELAQNNIEKLIKHFDLDYETYIIDWGTYRELLIAYMNKDMIDLELLYDNAMIAVNYHFAYKYNNKTIFSGDNQQTEGIPMPPEWYWPKLDATNIKSMARKNKINLNNFPLIHHREIIFNKIRGIRRINFLDYIEYNKKNATKELLKIGYKPYPFKHYESVFTRFYQGEILPKKFSVDKRLVHLSTLINDGQINKEEALSIIKKSPYESEDLLYKDYKYVCKKLKINEKFLKDYMNRKEKSHLQVNSHVPMIKILSKIKNMLGYPKSIKW